MNEREKKIREKISEIRSKVEELSSEAREAWEADACDESLMWELEDIADALGELELEEEED